MWHFLRLFRQVLPGTSNMQSPYAAYWPSGDVNAYGGSMSNGVSWHLTPSGGTKPRTNSSRSRTSPPMRVARGWLSLPATKPMGAVICFHHRCFLDLVALTIDLARGIHLSLYQVHLTRLLLS